MQSDNLIIKRIRLQVIENGFFFVKYSIVQSLFT